MFLGFFFNAIGVHVATFDTHFVSSTVNINYN